LRIIQTEIQGVFDLITEPRHDSRGFFARIYCPEELAAAGIDFTSTQINLSRNAAAFTLRGMHWQDPPHAEAKLVRAVTGIIHDVVVDLRPESLTYRRWIARRLSAKAANALFIPEGCAHGFLTLEPNTDVLYQMSRPYVAGFARGLRWDDPTIGIEWPAKPLVIGKIDQVWRCPWLPSSTLE
jgi:dTDP-4-dehydrorhamnose 3,5-epimerase